MTSHFSLELIGITAVEFSSRETLELQVTLENHFRNQGTNPCLISQIKIQILPFYHTFSQEVNYGLVKKKLKSKGKIQSCRQLEVSNIIIFCFKGKKTTRYHHFPPENPEISCSILKSSFQVLDTMEMTRSTGHMLTDC